MVSEMGTITMGLSVGSVVLGLVLFGLIYIRLGSIRDILQGLLNSQTSRPTGNAWGSPKWECPKCKAKNPNSTFTCEKCGYSLK